MLKVIYRFKDQAMNVALYQDSEVVIGRTGGMPVQLDLSADKGVSRAHARLFLDGAYWFITDLGSRHGTFVNGKKVSDKAEVLPGDEIQIGQTTLYLDYQLPDDSQETGGVVTTFVLDADQPILQTDESARIDLLTRISAVMNGGPPLAPGFLRALLDSFTQAERGTVVLLDSEAKPFITASHPHDQSAVSFMHVNKVIETKNGFLWRAQQMATPSIKNADTKSAMYAPLVYQGRVLGVLHLDTTLMDRPFEVRDVELLAEAARMMGPALAQGKDNAPVVPSVFVSYSHRDQTFVRQQLVPDLRRSHINVYYDEHLRTGEPWRKQLAVAIERTDALVLVMSPDSIASPEVIWETSQAQSLKRAVFPLMYQTCTIPGNLSGLQYIDLRADYREGLRKLVRDLELLKRGG